MPKKILRRPSQPGARSRLLALLLAAAPIAGCSDEDGPEGSSALGDSGNGAFASDAALAIDAAVPSAMMTPPIADAGRPVDAALSFDAAPPRDAASGADARADSASGTGAPDAAPAGPNPEPGRLAGITAAHNAARARVPTDKPLPPLSWSPEIAAVAQAYADKLAASCSTTLVHSTTQERMGWGENLAMMSGFGSMPAGSAQQAVDLWEGELMCYTFGAFQAGVNATCTSACSASGGCGHYTQLVWRKTMRLGCGVGECTSGSSKRAFWVCNYDPPGNYLGQTPY